MVFQKIEHDFEKWQNMYEETTRDVDRAKQGTLVLLLGTLPKDEGPKTCLGENVYYVESGITRSVGDGFWLFIKPLEVGNHTIYFKGETLLTEPYSKSEMRKATVDSRIWKDIDMNQPFEVECYMS